MGITVLLVHVSDIYSVFYKRQPCLLVSLAWTLAVSLLLVPRLKLPHCDLQHCLAVALWCHSVPMLCFLGDSVQQINLPLGRWWCGALLFMGFVDWEAAWDSAKDSEDYLKVRMGWIGRANDSLGQIPWRCHGSFPNAIAFLGPKLRPKWWECPMFRVSHV